MGQVISRREANAWNGTMTAVLRPRLRSFLSLLFLSFFVDAAMAQGLNGRFWIRSGRAVPNAGSHRDGPTAAPLRARTVVEGK
jgi:hypothetical protein